MPQFSYKAKRRSGELVEGLLEVNDRPAALAQIQRLGLFPVAVDAARAGTIIAANGKPAASGFNLLSFLPPSLRAKLKEKRKPKMQELATYTSQLANLLQSGMPLTTALGSMTHLESKGISAEVSRELKTEVTEGRSLSDAMAKQPGIFSDLYINMVRAGEQSGSLVQVLRRMASHLAQFAEVQAKFSSAMIYPILVMVVGAGIIALFMFFMMPRFMSIFNSFNVELPLPTQILMGATRLLTKFWWLLAGVIMVIVILFKRFQSSESGGAQAGRTAPETARRGQGGKIEFVRSVCPHPWNAAPKRRARADRLEDHRASFAESHPEGSHRQNPRGGDRRQNPGPAAGGQQGVSPAHGGLGAHRRGNGRRARRV